MEFVRFSMVLMQYRLFWSGYIFTVSISWGCHGDHKNINVITPCSNVCYSYYNVVSVVHKMMQSFYVFIKNKHPADVDNNEVGYICNRLIVLCCCPGIQKIQCEVVGSIPGLVTLVLLFT